MLMVARTLIDRVNIIVLKDEAYFVTLIDKKFNKEKTHRGLLFT